MIDKATYDDLAQRLEAELYEHSKISWHVFHYDERAVEACISEKTAQEMSTTPDAHFVFTYEQMLIAFAVRIGRGAFQGCIPISRALFENGIPETYIGIVKQLAAEEITRTLIEQGVI